MPFDGGPVNLSDPSGHRFTTGDDTADAAGACGELCNPLDSEAFSGAQSAVRTQQEALLAFYDRAPAPARRELDRAALEQSRELEAQAAVDFDLLRSEYQSSITEQDLRHLEMQATKAGDKQSAQVYAALYAVAVRTAEQREKCLSAVPAASCALPTTGICIESSAYVIIGAGGSTCLVESNYGAESGLALSRSVGLGFGAGASAGGLSPMPSTFVISLARS